MTTKRKKKVDSGHISEKEETLIALKERYFKLLKKEKLGKTQKITSMLDEIEKNIKEQMIHQ